MENLYNLTHKLKIKDSNFECIARLSSTNLFAFSSEIDIETGEKGFFVYVNDVNLPFSYLITSRKYPVSVIEWDQSGNYLLVTDTFGLVEVYGQKNNLISEWYAIHTTNFPNENVIAAKFFHNGIIIKYHHDKKEQVQYSEKFQRVKFQPSVRKFGGVPEFGCIVITSTGMIGTFLVDTNANNTPALPQDACQSTKSLGLTRSLYTIGDICFNDGSFFVAVADTSSKNPSIIIQCYRVIIERKGEELIISSQSLPSFFNESAATKDLMDLKILKIKWMAQEDSDSLIVASNFINGSLMEIWKLSEEATPIHKFFQTNKNESYKTLAWSCQQNYKYTSKITDVATTKVQFGPNFYIFIAYQDNVIHCLNRESLKRIAISTVNFQRNNNDSQDHPPPLKLQKFVTKLASIDVSFLGHMLLAIDYSGQVSSFKLNFDHIMNSITQSVNLLEYCMVCGLDTLDSMLILKTSMLDVIVDKLSDNFNRQPNHVTQYYYVKFLTQKINLYRLSANGQSKAHDLTCLLNLISILTAFKSLLRPADLTTTKSEYRQVLKTPAENLAMNLSESVPDVDKVLLNLDNKLETKDFTVEPSTLQSLQQLIQFVADLALNILAKLPESRSFQNKSPGELSEIVSLNSIRELLVMIRIWGLVKKSCLPVFSRSADNLDILATLFRLLTKLSLNPSEPDELLLDECCLLPSQVLIPQLQYNTPRPSLTSPMLPNLQLPLQLEHGVESELLDYQPEIHYVEGCLANNSIIDSIRYIQLGKSPANLRRCSRCGSYTALKSVARTTAMKAWELRWQHSCRCGGFWKLEKD